MTEITNYDCEIMSRKLMEVARNNEDMPVMCYVKSLLMAASALYNENNTSNKVLNIEFVEKVITPPITE